MWASYPVYIHSFSSFVDGYIYWLSDIVSIAWKIWVYGNSLKSKLIAVIIPQEENTKKWASSHGLLGTFSELCSLDQLKNYVLSELNSTAERNKVILIQTKLIHVLQSLCILSYKLRNTNHYQLNAYTPRAVLNKSYII